MNLATAFRASAKAHPHKHALFWGEQEFTYAALEDQSLRVATALQRDMGVGVGDRVGLWLKNCPEYIPAVFGVLLAGGVVVPINNFLKPDEVGFILNDAGIEALITDATVAEHQHALTRLRPTLRISDIAQISSGTAGAKADTAPFPHRNQSDLAVIIYTSGTTGRPKGAMLSHGNLLHNVESCRIVLRAVGDDRFAVILPLFHSFMLCVGLFLPLLVGGSIVLVKSLHPLKNLVQEIVGRRASILPAIPQFFRSMVHAPLGPELPLRACFSGAAPLPMQVLTEWSRKFTVPLLEGYGLSEASPVVSMNPLGLPSKPGSIGKPIPHVEMSVQNDAGECLPPGRVGEICVRGGNVMQGYWNQPEETARTLRRGWLLTGDIGYRDSDGYFYITDRKKDMLLVNGLNVYPREIEEVIYQFPGVKETAVIGVPDPRKGEQPVAYLSPNDGAQVDEQALIHFLRSRLADYKVPRQIMVLPTLPRNSTGKILKTSLRAMASGEIQSS